MSALSPAVVAAIDDLELAARLIVEGLRTGGHRSPFHGFSTEFRQHRPYRLGDDLKYLDWKLFARSDRLYTRQFRETTNFAVMLVLDTSASMAFPERGLSKLRYATIAAAALAYLASEQGHGVGLMTMAEGKLVYLPARGGRQHLRTLMARLDRIAASDGWEATRVLSRAAQLLERRGVIIMLSDLYDDEEGTRRELRRAVQRGHDVAALQIVSDEERHLPFGGQVEIEDLESGERRLVDAGDVASVYRESFESFLERCRAQSLRDGIDYALMTTSTAPETALREYLLRRGRRAVADAPRAASK